MRAIVSLDFADAMPSANGNTRATEMAGTGPAFEHGQMVAAWTTPSRPGTADDSPREPGTALPGIGSLLAVSALIVILALVAWQLYR